MSTILCLATSSPLRRSFDYLPSLDFNAEDLAKLQPGMRLRVPFGSREVIGIFLGCVAKTSIDPAKLKRVIKVIDNAPLLPESIFKLCVWASDYYHHALGDVLFSALPKLLRKGAEANIAANLPRRKKKNDENTNLDTNIDENIEPEPIWELNAAQQDAITSIIAHQNLEKVFLLDGVTGSGKTEVYLRAIAAVLQAGKQALILIPEISLTPQTLARFQRRFAKRKIVVFHSRLNDRERLLAWLLAREGGADIVIGTRSALFTPLAHPGIIILDEEHDLSFKQQSGLRYSARDLAVVRSKLEKTPLVLGSATPSLESLANVERGRYVHLSLPNRVGNALPPQFKIIDMCKKRLKSGLSPEVILAIEQHLAKAGQVLIFVNRRGYAPSLLCHQCGWVASCEQCDVRLTLHQKEQYLRCHHCDTKTQVPKSCPKCSCQELMPCGYGTERLETGVQKLFPNVIVARIDSDTTRKKGSLQEALANVHSGDSRILIGTQILTKGHHFPDVTLVVILNADGGLFSADFRASEYLAQLITQVAGRAGRETKPGMVYIQTHHPDHPLLFNLLRDGYGGFAKIALEERCQAAFPPYAHLALLRAEGKNRDEVYKFLEMLRDYGIRFIDKDKTVELLGPVAAVVERKAANYCAQLLLQSSERQGLHRLIHVLIAYAEKLPAAKRVKWVLEVDPMEVV